ncbi:MAG: electron transport complex subunit RsxE [Gammaproteobacteria bacterium]|jgi:electron transport complex protein RnfE|nr:electron transport complex subunit RsxE [Gammaproteobacteria bacterium]MBP6050485.1 electron transport complex subunit RsxE [Pseudomonadales bacterium]MBK7169898.1 electron transport complex subunit RsxE [Gammaproteobacteria bacterium]MBK7521934.1 electron transport complex subunit RsxE [Gammaproteobacteria bacterium]MBK7727592.1 electron transport complex subunit RsxE [Gammaproteobacteria bacterium]
MSDLEEQIVLPKWQSDANPAAVKLLGLCPLLAMSHSLVTALALGLAMLGVMLVSSVLIALLRKHLAHPLRLLVWLLLIAASVCSVELLMQAFAWQLHQALGIYLPLIAASCLVLQRAESVASRNPVAHVAADALFTGGGLLGAMLLLGALRELLGNGTVLADMELLFGATAAGWKLQPFAGQGRFLLAILPPGAFLFAGLLLALKNLVDSRRASASRSSQPAPAPGSRRVRSGAIQP